MSERNGDLPGQERIRMVEALEHAPAYRLAWQDEAFLDEDALRPFRLAAELLKPELVLSRHRIRTSIVVFGSARTLPPEVARRRVEAARRRVEAAPDDDEARAALRAAEAALEQSAYYEEARRFAQIVSRDFVDEERCDLVVFTGGGPGIMEAANRGAWEVGSMSAGLNITIPTEQKPNPFISPELCFRFHYFAIRKMHFLMRARALVAFPGGFGTMDELFEALTLSQTGKMPRIPIVLVGSAFWNRAVDFEFLAEQGVIGRRDLDLFTVVDRAEDAVRTIYDYYGGTIPEPGEVF